jgi:non-canonical poly(A) RNA polymerase PAPD5/7
MAYSDKSTVLHALASNLGVLVMEFFELYGLHFNYDDVGISLRDGGTYFNKRQRGWHAEYKKNSLSIEDPANPCK